MTGQRSSGKTLFYDILKYCFETYISQTNSENLLKKTFRGNDISKENHWQMVFEFSRIVFTSEIEFSRDKKSGTECSSINGCIIKKISGGDTLSARLNNKNERHFKIQSSLIICCNDLPDIEPIDTIENCIKFNMPCSFLTDDSWNLKSEIEKKIINRRKADSSLKDFYIHQDNWINSFINIIIDNYGDPLPIPESMQIQIKRDNFCTESDFDSLIKLFIFHKNTKFKNCNSDCTCEDNFVKFTDIKQLLEINRITITNTKATNFLRQCGCIDFRDKSYRGLKGISINSNF
jgi:hypothetical protein